MRSNHCVSWILAILFLSIFCWPGRIWAEQPYHLEWLRQVGTSNYDWGNSVSVDSGGNVYVAGSTEGNLGGQNAGDRDAYLIKFNSSGNQVWTRQIGTALDDYGNAVTTDASGNAYISGWTYGSLCEARQNNTDSFLVKYDPGGNKIWGHQTGLYAYNESKSVAVSQTGKVYISGSTTRSDTGAMDAFLTQYDSAGHEIWSRQGGSYTFQTTSNSVGADAAGNSYICGETHQGLFGTYQGSGDAFLVKYDEFSTVVWKKQIGTSGYDSAYSVAVDSNGNVYVAGESNGALGGPNKGTSDAFLIKYNSNGVKIWSRQIGTAGSDSARSVALDPVGNVYLCGNLGQNVSIIKYDTLGNQLWSGQIGAYWNYPMSIAVDANQNIYFSGSIAGLDVLVAKYSIPEPCALALLVMGGVAILRRRKQCSLTE